MINSSHVFIPFLIMFQRMIGSIGTMIQVATLLGTVDYKYGPIRTI